jgi:hypothetical protein
MLHRGLHHRTLALVLGLALSLSAAVLASTDASAASEKYGYPTIGSKAALANSNCDANAERVKQPFPPQKFAGIVSGFPCVTAFPKGADNGGATSPGVTGDTVKIVYFNSTTDQNGQNAADSFRDWVDTYASLHTETYGRKIEVTDLRASGSSEAEQRADAVRVAQLKPFIVVDGPGSGGVFFDADLAKRKIISFGYSVTPESGAKQQPYRYGLNPDADALQANVASVAAPLVGQKAKWAGGDLKSQTRKFAVVAPDSINGGKVFVDQFKKVGGRATAFEYPYTPSSFVSQPDSYADQIPTIISRMRSAGVTTVVTFGDLNFLPVITKAATDQDFFPEWLMTGFQYQDIDAFSRANSSLSSTKVDQTQWAHAFGMGTLGPDTSASATLEAWYKYYWGPDRPNFGLGREAGSVQPIYDGIALAGPKLTPQSFQTALFKDPYNFYGRKYLPWTSYQQGGLTGRLLWWDPTAKGPSNAVGIDGTGKYQYLFNADAFLPGKFPKKLPPYFDPSKSVLVLNNKIVGPLYPCDGCPSQTATS